MNQLYIDGTWRDATDGGTREVRCPADGQLVATVAEGTAEDAQAAVRAARRAYDDGPWRATSEKERGQLLFRLADVIDRDRKVFSRAESLDTGKRLVEADYDMDDVIASIRYYAGIAGTDAGRVVDTGSATTTSRIVYSPIGVCALITPWNYPLLQTSWKVAPALLAGNTFVLKPSELTPSTAGLLMEALEEVGLPPGVGNLVLGAGPVVGAPLTSDPAVDMVSFTGGIVSGRRVMAEAAATVKRVALELGGKNPNVVFADADFDTAVDMALTAVFLHSGQVCSAGARLVVEERLHDAFVDALVERAQRIRLGGPFDPEAETGTLISAAHREKVEAYVAAGLAEGAVLRCGGRRPDDPKLADGFFYLPTILDRCDQTMSVVHEESFGPVLTVETLHRRGRRRTDRERHGVRAGRRRLDAGRREGPAGRRAAGARHGLDQRLPPLRPAGRVGRLQAVRQRPRARTDRSGGVPRDQAHLAEHRPLATALVQRRGPERGWRRSVRRRHGGQRVSTATTSISSNGSAELAVENLWKVFGARPEQVTEDDALRGVSTREIKERTGCVAAVRDVSFEVGHGEVFVVMGLSGSGKSTLVRCLTRLIEPTAGSIVFQGDGHHARRPRTSCATCAARRSRWCSSTSACCRTAGWWTTWPTAWRSAASARPSACKRAGEVIELVGLSGYENSYPDQLSGGMQQRVGLARALATDPEMLLFDEPFSALDPLIRRDMQNEVIRLHHEVGKTMVFITHDLAEALKLGDRILIMRDGAPVQIGSGDELVGAPGRRLRARLRPRRPPGRRADPEAGSCGRSPPGEPTDGAELGPDVVIREAVRAVLASNRPVKVVEDGQLLGVVGEDEILDAMVGAPISDAPPTLSAV